jgi:hypothetical protein
MNQRRYRALAFWSFLSLYVAHAGAADSPEYDPKFEPGAVDKWRESDVSLPMYPADDDLVDVPLSATDTFRFYIDRRSLSRGEDRVVRLTAVIQSPRGARSIFYDGIRCDTREYKTYAVGSSESRWRPNRDAQWQIIDARGLHGFRYQLYRYYVCDATNNPRAPAAILTAVAHAATGRD